jgi:UDP-N-acetylglucosamine diphosphorylase/glucosamine-1-phosphate N-acetyltransferase
MVDDGRRTLAPLDDLRPIWDVRTGARTTRQRVESVLGLRAVAGLCPVDRVTCSREPLSTESPEKQPLLLVNARCVLPPEQIATLAIGQSLMDSSGRIISIHASPDDADEAADAMLKGSSWGEVISCQSASLLEHPWDVIRFRDEAIRVDLLDLLRDRSRYKSEHPEGTHILGTQPLAIDLGATVCPGVVLDLQHGPIVIERGATIRPGAILVGPCYVGPESWVLEHTLVKANTSIGPVCKVAGEIGGTIFQGHANKAHHGHLGDSWVGEWVNLGAGTVNSNLLNTYGEIVARATMTSSRVRTGMIYLGAILGDHAKTAIGTRLMTGSVLATGTMVASSTPPPACTDRFDWITDAGTSTYRLNKFLDVASTMMARRDVSTPDAYRDRLAALHEQRSSDAS